MDRFEEKAFVRKLTRMNDGAWEYFCKQYSAPLLEFVQWHFGCALQESEEIVQMVFVRCVKSIGTFDPRRGGVFQWLKAVAKNEGHTCFRRHGKRNAEMSLSVIPDHVLGQIAGVIDRAPLPDDVLARKELRILVGECLTEVNRRYREALLGKYVDGLKVSEIAARWDTTEKAVESLLSRARESFKSVILGKLQRQRVSGSEMPQ